MRAYDAVTVMVFAMERESVEAPMEGVEGASGVSPALSWPSLELVEVQVQVPVVRTPMHQVAHICVQHPHSQVAFPVPSPPPSPGTL